MIARLVTDIYAEDPRLVPERRESLSMDARPHRRSVHLVNNEEGLRVLAAYAPRAITGYPHHLADLLAVVEATGAAYPGPPFFFTTGEVLSSGVLASAGRLFPGCRNLDVYGLQECGDVAWQCSPGSAYHVNADWLVVEIVKQGRPAGPGEIGEVLVTDLTDLTMPLIRLRTGDLVKVTDRPCHCGIALPVIGRVEGRLADAMSLGEGSAMTPRAVLDRIPAPIRRFRIAQSPHDLRLDVTYEPGCSLERQSVRDRVFQPFSDRGISVRSTCVPESPRQHPKFIPITSGVIRSVDEVTDWHE
jgi:phenylacetate-coenzyme A ligase PaaK-like adenylate-forming protein